MRGIEPPPPYSVSYPEEDVDMMEAARRKRRGDLGHSEITRKRKRICCDRTDEEQNMRKQICQEFVCVCFGWMLILAILITIIIMIVRGIRMLDLNTR